jgi:trigger factor
MIENLRRQRTEWKAVDRAAVEGDRLKVDYSGTIEGEKIEGASAENSPIVLGAANLVEGFEDQLIGVKAGEACTVSVTFPADYHAEGLAGKAVQFDVKVHAIEESVLPEIDAAFVSSFGVKEGGIEALRTEVRKSMERELEQAIHARAKRHVMDALVKANALDLPATLVRQESERLLQQMVERLPKGTDVSALGTEQFDNEARRRVKLGLVISAIVKRNDMKAAPDKVRATIESIAAPYENPREVVNYYYGNRELLNSVEALVLEDEIVAWALRSARVTEKSLSFKELTGTANGTNAG